MPNTLNKQLAAVGLISMGTLGFASQAQAELEVDASVAVSNIYLWRGVDLGQGDAAVSGDINVSMAGAYAGVWTSSGDAAAGTEYDLYLGYGGEVSGFSYDVSVWNYIYPNGGGILDDFGGLTEVILSAGYGPVSVSYYDNIAGGSGYSYVTLGFSYDKFSATIGSHMSDNAPTSEFTHLDLSYSHTDNLSFTVSKVIEEDVDGASAPNNETNIAVTYSIPIM